MQSPTEKQTVPQGEWSPFAGENWLRGGISQASDGGMAWLGGGQRDTASVRRDYFSRVHVNISASVSADQIHGTHVQVIASREDCTGILDPGGRIPQTDGFVTRVPGVVLTTMHADCAPVFLADPEHHAIGLIHAGWRGTLAGIAGNALQLMAATFGTRPNACLVALGPTISTAHYEVGADVANRFSARFGDQTVMKTLGKEHLDIAAAIIVDLLESGLHPDHIPARPPCTFSGGDFASFRRDGTASSSMIAWFARV